MEDKKKILVIDDDALNVRLIQAQLEKAGYAVDFAMNGDTGLEKVKKVIPNLIILDVEMPGMNGYTFMLEMRKLDGLSEIPVVVLTAHSDMQPIFQLKGVNDYLIKPVENEQLLMKIKKILN